MKLFLLLLLHHNIISIAFAVPSTDHCLSHCGPHAIPYPFGLVPDCSLPGFNLSCLEDQLFLSDLLVLDISNGELRVDSTPFVASDCASGAHALSRIALPTPGPFAVSSSANRLVAAGCDTVAVVSGADGRSSGGCVSLCSGTAGSGFCEAALPERQRSLGFGVGNMFGYKNVSASDDCSYAFVVEKGMEELDGEKWREVGRKGRRVAMRLQWEIVVGGGGSKCLECGENGYCVESVDGHGGGYLCYCTLGFDGNPYLHGSMGCQGEVVSQTQLFTRKLLIVCLFLEHDTNIPKYKILKTYCNSSLILSLLSYFLGHLYTFSVTNLNDTETFSGKFIFIYTHFKNPCLTMTNFKF